MNVNSPPTGRRRHDTDGVFAPYSGFGAVALDVEFHDNGVVYDAVGGEFQFWTKLFLIPSLFIGDALPLRVPPGHVMLTLPTTVI